VFFGNNTVQEPSTERCDWCRIRRFVIHVVAGVAVTFHFRPSASRLRDNEQTAGVISVVQAA